MNEGELKKRILQEKVGWRWHYDYEGKAIEIQELKVDKILDEAFAEFPLWTAFRAMPKAKYPSGEIVDNEESYREEVYAWLEKWFGDESMGEST